MNNFLYEVNNFAKLKVDNDASHISFLTGLSLCHGCNFSVTVQVWMSYQNLITRWKRWLYLCVISSSHNLEDCIDRLLEMDRTQKIVFVLQDKDSLLKYLTNVPIELIPEVFAFPHGRQPVYLDIVYSTMRWWNMPLLYSYYICVKSDTKRKREMTV
jgi:hypothetical protein